MRSLLSVSVALIALVVVLVPISPAEAALPAGEVVLPTDELTVADSDQLTGRRLNLPLPEDCETFASRCDEVALLNQLDGFDLDPRIEVQLDAAPADIAAEFTDDVLYVQPVDGGDRIGLTRFVYDPATSTLYGHPVSQLADSTTYRAVYEAPGGTSETTFTTLSATHVLAQMRRQLDDGSAHAAAGIPADDRGIDFEAEDGTRTVFNAPEVVEITRYDQRTTDCEDLTEEAVLDTELLGSELYAFGSFRSPSWLDADRTIPQTPTATGEPQVLGEERVGITLIVPDGAAPADGWPVAIFGPGITRSKYDLWLAADANAAQGIATMSFDPAGHAYGECSEVGVTTISGGGEVRFSGFGRGFDQDGDGEITNQEGISAPGSPHPKSSIALRDGLRQTAADVMALVRAIGEGVDVDGDGEPDLRPDGVSLYAQSLGGIYGTMVMGVDPQVEVGVLNVPGGPIVDIARLSPVFRAEVTKALELREPCLLNGGINKFDESLPLFLDPPVDEPVDGAIPIQEVLASTNWINRPGSPETFAPLLREQPLDDSAAKRVLYQYAFGDQTVPNPTSATIARAGDLLDVTAFYRNDRTTTADTNPHGFLLDPRIQGRNQAQQQVVEFIASDGADIIDPDGGGDTWEVPIAVPDELEPLNYSTDLYAEEEQAPDGCGVLAAGTDRGSDADGAADPDGGTLADTGGGAALVGLVLLGSAVVMRRRFN